MVTADDLPLIPAIEARLAEARKTATLHEIGGFANTALAWSCKADAYADCLRLAEKQHRAYSDASTARLVQEEAVPASHAGTASKASLTDARNDGTP